MKLYQLVLLAVSGLQAIPSASACAHPPVRRQNSASNANGTIEYPYGFVGPDTPADPATTGYFINHLCINTKNTTASIEFYTRAFGLRHIFSSFPTKSLTISYLGHAHGGKNGTGYQTGAELNREKNNSEGLIEIVEIKVAGNPLVPSTLVPNTFGHIGIVVPDLAATQQRLETLGVNIVKRSGEPYPRSGPVLKGFGLPDTSGLDEEDLKALFAVLDVSVGPLIFVTDPDGNLIEIQPQESPSLV